MRLTVPTTFHRVSILGGYILWPLTIWFSGGGWWCVSGIVVAYAIDRFCPRWMTDFSIDELGNALSNFLQDGFLGSHLYLDIGGRTLFVHRGEMRGQPILSLQFNRQDWMGIIDESLEQYFLRKWCDILMPEQRWRVRQYVKLVVAPERVNGIDSIISMIRECSSRSSTDVEQIRARVDYARRPIRDIFESIAGPEDSSEGESGE